MKFQDKFQLIRQLVKFQHTRLPPFKTSDPRENTTSTGRGSSNFVHKNDIKKPAGHRTVIWSFFILQNSLKNAPPPILRAFCVVKDDILNRRFEGEEVVP